MQIVLVVLVCLISVFQTSSPIKQSQTLVEVWCGGDDNLTQGVCRALDREFASSPDFVVSSDEKPGTLIVSIPANVDWKEKGKRTRVFYKVEFKSTNGRKLGTKKVRVGKTNLESVRLRL
jgi:hypothetical protein